MKSHSSHGFHTTFIQLACRSRTKTVREGADNFRTTLAPESRIRKRIRKRRDGKDETSADVRADARSSGRAGAKSAAVREQAILALLSENTLGAGAGKCGVNEKTLRRWLAGDEAFSTAYAEARQAAFKAGMGRIQALTARAVDTLEDLLDAKKYPSARLGAARRVAKIGIHQHDAETIPRKLEEIEAAQQPR